MWLATLEDDEGMWLDDPIGADTHDEARKLAREAWGVLVHGVCDQFEADEAQDEGDAVLEVFELV